MMPYILSQIIIIFKILPLNNYKNETNKDT